MRSGQTADVRGENAVGALLHVSPNEVLATIDCFTGLSCSTYPCSPVTNSTASPGLCRRCSGAVTPEQIGRMQEFGSLLQLCRRSVVAHPAALEHVRGVGQRQGNMSE